MPLFAVALAGVHRQDAALGLEAEAGFRAQDAQAAGEFKAAAGLAVARRSGRSPPRTGCGALAFPGRFETQPQAGDAGQRPSIAIMPLSVSRLRKPASPPGC